MPTHELQIQWARGNESIVKRISKTADGGADCEVSVPNASNNMAITAQIDVSALKMLYICSTKNLTLETNSGSAADDTLALLADEPVVWWDGCGWECPLTVDVTALFATQNSGATATLTIHTLQDLTP